MNLQEKCELLKKGLENLEYKHRLNTYFVCNRIDEDNIAKILLDDDYELREKPKEAKNGIGKYHLCNNCLKQNLIPQCLNDNILFAIDVDKKLTDADSDVILQCAEYVVKPKRELIEELTDAAENSFENNSPLVKSSFDYSISYKDGVNNGIIDFARDLCQRYNLSYNLLNKRRKK